MNKGVWVWPTDEKGQKRTLRKVADALHLVPAMAAIAKSKEGLSNSELDDALADSAEWMTLWVVRQLTSLGFIEFKVDLFGGPAKYKLTDRGRNALSVITGKPVQVQQPAQPQQKPAAPPPPPAQPPPQQKPPAASPPPAPVPQAAAPKT